MIFYKASLFTFHSNLDYKVVGGYHFFTLNHTRIKIYANIGGPCYFGLMVICRWSDAANWFFTFWGRKFISKFWKYIHLWQCTEKMVSGIMTAALHRIKKESYIYLHRNIFVYFCDNQKLHRYSQSCKIQIQFLGLKCLNI